MSRETRTIKESEDTKGTKESKLNTIIVRLGRKKPDSKTLKNRIQGKNEDINAECKARVQMPEQLNSFKQHKITDRGINRPAVRSYNTLLKGHWRERKNIAIILNNNLI